MTLPRDNTYAFNKGLIQPQDSVSKPEVSDPTSEIKEEPKQAKKKAGSTSKKATKKK